MTDADGDSFITACLKNLGQKAFYNAYAKTFSVVPADTDELRAKAFRLRHLVYCVENHFLDPLKYPDELERDAFDDHALHWLLIHRGNDEVVGTIRLLLPHDDRPLVSFELQKTCDHPLLQIENRVLGLCEISRFCVAPHFRRRVLDGKLLPSYYDQEEGGAGKSLFRRAIPYAPLGLLQAAFEAAMDHGIHSCLMTIEPRQLESFARLGINSRTLGPGLSMHGAQQPVIFGIKGALDNMAAVNPECWEIVSDRGRLQRRANELYRRAWHSHDSHDTAQH